MRFDIGKRNNDNVVLNKGQEAAVTNLIDFIAAPFDARNNIQALCTYSLHRRHFDSSNSYA